ncbi:hypothetical protein ACHAW6_016111 [Cyclotella cf. meneghiniana]
MLLSNLYGQKQAGCVLTSILAEKLNGLGFQQSLIDECVFHCDDIIFVVYVDDVIFLGPDECKLTNVIKEMKKIGLDIEDQGWPADYVGVTITKHSNGYFKFIQRDLIDSIINDVNIGDAYTKTVPAKASMQLHAFKDSPKFTDCNFNFNYHSVTGKLNYLGQTTHGDILFATTTLPSIHQILGKNMERAILEEAMAHRDHAQIDPGTAKSRSGWIIFYAKSLFGPPNCNPKWHFLPPRLNKLPCQWPSEVAFLLELLDEMKGRNFQVLCTHPIVYCKGFEDNIGALELACLPKLCPWAKHINACYHHFREHG